MSPSNAPPRRRARKAPVEQPQSRRRADKSSALGRVLNCVPSSNSEQDWQLIHAMESGMVVSAPVPESRDLREPWWNIGDQGQTGASVGWATGDSVLRWHFATANRLPKRQTLSPRYLWMAAKETDESTRWPTTFLNREGTSLKATLEVARKFGAVPEAALPTSEEKLFSGDARSFFALAARWKIASYFNLGLELTAWRLWIALKGPVLVRVDVDDTFDGATSTRGKLARHQPGTRRGGHSVALVGYTPQFFIVRNSWGAGWGDEGFGYAMTAYAQEAFTEAYGVTL